jgi:hypothetical protein
MHAATHVPLQQEGDPAKHLPFRHAATLAQVGSNADASFSSNDIWSLVW